jgi:SAM-dependent methyltransferase
MMSGVSLIGGEMLHWSDRRPEERPPAGGPVLAHLLDRIAPLIPSGGHVLVAGPHDEALVDALSRHAPVTLLLRSHVDATAAADRGGATVLCGTLPKLTDAERYDVIVALDGLDRLCSVEGPQYDWAESLQALRRALRPGGTLLLSVENELGVHRLVDRSPATSPHTDSEWYPLGEFDGSRPGTPARLTAVLAAEGLDASWLGATWPLPPTPGLIATPDALRDAPGGALAAAAARAVALAYAGAPVLSDPRRIAAAAVRAGLGPELAASWLVVAHRAPLPPAAALPAVLAGDGPVTELTRVADGWTRRVVGGETAATPERDPARLDGPLPAGRLLEELLLGACVRYDLPALRRLLTGWAGWLATLGGERGYATVDNVVLDGETYALLDPSRRDAAPPDVPAAAVAALHRFAGTLLGGGYAHPWPAATETVTLTACLVGAAGLDVDPDEVPPPAPAEIPPPDSLREHLEQIRALQQQVEDGKKHVKWVEKQLAGKEKELRKTRKQLRSLRGSRAYQVARVGMGAARRARDLLRRVRR